MRVEPTPTKKSSIGKTFPSNNEMFDYFDTVTHILSIGFYAILFFAGSHLTMDLYGDFVAVLLCCCYFVLPRIVPTRSATIVMSIDANRIFFCFSSVIWADGRITANHHTQIHNNQTHTHTRALAKKSI